MTPDQLSNNVDSVIYNAEAAFGKTVTKTQASLFDQMHLLVNRMELNADGTIKQNQANRALLSKIDQYFNKAFSESGYYNELDLFTDSVVKITSENVAYFSFVKEGFSSNAQYIKSLQKQAISQVESLLANEGLEAAMKQPLVEILNVNVNTGASINDLLKQIREFSLGSDKLEGQLKRYSRQITNDALFNFSRSLQEGISQQVGLEWYKYVGGVISDSRPFCVSRNGKFYHKSEVEAWGNLSDWQGRRRGTTSSTIFIYAGGYNCRHSIIPVSEIAVPKSVKNKFKPVS